MVVRADKLVCGVTGRGLDTLRAHRGGSKAGLGSRGLDCLCGGLAGALIGGRTIGTFLGTGAVMVGREEKSHSDMGSDFISAGGGVTTHVRLTLSGDTSVRVGAVSKNGQRGETCVPISP